MALSENDLTELQAMLQVGKDRSVMVADLRRRFAGMTITECHPSDVDMETPYFALPLFSLYLVDNTDHCWRLTRDASRASGLVVVAHKSA
jgi:aspartokinase-like uncharacterized kinase